MNNATTSDKLLNAIDKPDRVALCAGRLYWIALVLTDDENVAATLTRNAAAVFTSNNQFLNPRLENWVCRLTIQGCIALQRAELSTDQRDSNAWDDATRELQSESLELTNNISMISIERAIRALPVLPRFMFVLRTLNRFPVQEVSDMMRIPRVTCEAANRYALVLLTKIVQSNDLPSWVSTHRFV